MRQENLRKVAVAKPAPKAAKEPTARERALEFSKNVPKPEIKPVDPAAAAEAGPGSKAGGGLGRGRPAAAAGGARTGTGAAAARNESGSRVVASEQGSMLAELEEQHQRDQQKVEQIRAELARMVR